MTRDGQPADDSHTPSHYTGIVCRRCKEPVAELADAATIRCPSCGYSWEAGPPLQIVSAV